MPNYPIMQVDAFADRPLQGNACAVVFDADGMDEATMQAVAREMNLSETSFVVRSGVADFGVRFFTPVSEIPLAGHPTIATAFALVESGRLRLEGERTRITLELRVGPIEVEIAATDGRVRGVTMRQPAPRFLRTYDAAEVLPAFGLAEDDLLPGAVVQTVSTGTPQLMVPLRGLEALRRAQLDLRLYPDLQARGDFFSPHLFCLRGATPEGRTFARHFGTPPDTSEDPFTGSATGGMAAYLWRYGLIDAREFVAEQGHWMERPGRADVRVVGDPERITAVEVGGAAALVFSGEMRL